MQISLSKGYLESCSRIREVSSNRN